MTTVIQRLLVLEYEAEADWGRHPAREAERFLDDDEVARLLSGAPERAQPDHGGEPAMALEVADEGDALAAMRGVMMGLALLTPFWALIAAIILQT